MSIFKTGQTVELRSGKRATILQPEIHEPGSMGNIEYYWVTLEDGQKLHVSGVDVMQVLAHANPSQKIKAVARKSRTQGIWYSWGPSEFNALWITACQQQRLLEHAVGIPKANDNLAGPGLYIARELWRSSVYAKPGATLLIITLNDVPTIDVRQANQMAELNNPPPPLVTEPDLKTEKVNAANIVDLARYFFIYTTNGNFGCLTAHKGVTCSVDLEDIPAASLLSQANKVGTEAAQPLWDQAQQSPRLNANTRNQLRGILRGKGAKTD